MLCCLSSGAYVFRPNGTAVPVIDGPISVTVQRTSVVTVITQHWAGWLTQVTRLWAGADYLDVEYFVGPIPVGESGVSDSPNEEPGDHGPIPIPIDDEGWEIVTRYSTGLASAGTWHTDSNGREMMRRKRYSHSSWPWVGDELVAGNYYPCTVGSYINDSEAMLAVVVDRPQGVCKAGAVAKLWREKPLPFAGLACVRFHCAAFGVLQAQPR
jgi:lysosomal alpha-mannosidase